MTTRPSLAQVTASVVGREREVELLVAALDCGAHVLLEGPPGTGKTTLLRAVASAEAVPFVFVEGNAELTPGRLVGHFDPAQVLEAGYTPDVFVDGPLVQALREGALLYVEEVNRVPEETLNVLLTVMSEAELHVPRLGRVAAASGFRLVAAMNPFDAVGTARISSAVYDRVCRITMGYQSAADEQAVVARQAVAPGAGPPDGDWQAQVVDLVRRTRDHPDIRVGSSVRGAIDTVRLAVSLGALRGLRPQSWRTGLDAALVALSGRIRLQESCTRTPEEVVRELYEQVFGREPVGDDEAGGGGASGSVSPPPGRGAGSDRPPSRSRGPQQRTTPRSQLASRAHFAEISPEVGVLDEEAFARAVGEDADAALTLLVDLGSATDERLRAAARALAGRVVLDRARAGVPRRSGTGKLRRQSADRGGDLDVEASLEGLLEARAVRRRPAADALVSVDWARPEVALCVLVDSSGSMGGDRLAAAALTAAACALRAPGECAVLSFAREVRVLRPLDSLRPPSAVVDAVLALRGHGVTALATALEEAGRQLAGSRAGRRVTILLSDCRSTDDRDAVPVARTLPELVVVAPATDSDEAAAFAARAGARWAPLAGPSSAPEVLRRLLS